MPTNPQIVQALLIQGEDNRRRKHRQSAACFCLGRNDVSAVGLLKLSSQRPHTKVPSRCYSSLNKYALNNSNSALGTKHMLEIQNENGHSPQVPSAVVVSHFHIVAEADTVASGSFP